MNRLRIIWLSHFVPYPPKGGCFQRSYNLIRRVGAAHDLHLVAMKHKQATHPEYEVRDAREELLRHCRTVDIVDISRATTTTGLLKRAGASILKGEALNVSIYRSAETREIVRALGSRYDFDVAHFDTIGLAQYLPEVGDVPALVTHHGAEAYMVRRRISREANPLRKAFFVYEWLTLERYERAMCERFDVNIVMSDDDGRIMQGVAPGATFRTVANGVDVDYFQPLVPPASRRVIFAGRLDQYSNRDGILHFLQNAWPLVRERYAEAAIDVIGMNPPEALMSLAERDERVRVHGFVPDVRPYFQQAAVAICPVRDGGGTRIKVLDALAQGTPMVSTTIGCEGLDVVPERDVLVANSSEEFVRQIGRVFEDEALRERLSKNGRTVIEARYSWNVLAKQLVEQYLVAARREVSRVQTTAD